MERLGDDMEVTFRRTGDRRYGIAVRRQGYPDVDMNPAPGYDPRMPHDLMHFVVESQLGMPLGVFGQLEAGGDAGSFRQVREAAVGVREARRSRRRDGKRAVRLSKQGHDDATFSERAAVLCEYEWLIRSTEPERRAKAQAMAPYVRRVREQCSAEELAALSGEVMDAICVRLEELSTAWARLEIGEGLTLEWIR